jgi:RHS repeat-associated protein
VIAEYDENDNLLRKFVYGPGIDEPICMIDVADNNAVYYYHFDGLGSVIALSNANKQIIERYSYDVFGEPNRTSDVNNPYLFTGRRYDPEAGLYYYRARYYAYDIGRFLQTDPTGYDDGMNMYTSVANNPVSLVDPYGLEAMFDLHYDYVRRVVEEEAQRQAEWRRQMLQAHMDEAEDYRRFVGYARGRTEFELRTETRVFGVPAGPAEYRYVRDPADPTGRVIDMRHFFVVGHEGPLAGYAVETFQLFGMRDSAFHPQDLFSNRLGFEFYRRYFTGDSMTGILVARNEYAQYPVHVLLNEYFRDRARANKKQGGN